MERPENVIELRELFYWWEGRVPCHGTLQGRGRLRVTDSKRLLL